MKQALCIAAIAAFLCRSFYPAAWLDGLISALCALIVAVLFRSVKGFVRGMGVAFLATGVALLAAHGTALPQYVASFGNMLNILSFFALIPLIAIPIELGSYALRVQTMIQSRVKHSGALYSMTSLLSYILSAFMNLATLPMMYHTIRPSLDLYPIEQKERFITRAITHGYSMPILWTPVASIVGIVVEMTGVKWSSILPILVPFSLAGLLLDWLMGVWLASRRKKRLGEAAWNEVAASREEATHAEERQAALVGASHPAHILAAVVLFNAVIFVLEQYSGLSFLLVVSVAVVPFAWGWAALIGKGGLFWAKAGSAFPQQVLKMKDQFFVFLSAGFMITAIQTTGAGHAINAGILAAKAWMGGDLFLLLVPLIPLALAFVGLHPAVGLALTAESLNPQALGISVTLTAIAMLTGAATAFLMGPYNATAGLMSGLTGQSAYRVSNWNAPFTAVYLGAVMMLLVLLRTVWRV